MALLDLDRVAGLDTDHSYNWGDQPAAQGRIAVYALAHLSITADGRTCPLRQTGLDVVNDVDGKYVKLGVEALCPACRYCCRDRQ